MKSIVVLSLAFVCFSSSAFANTAPKPLIDVRPIVNIPRPLQPIVLRPLVRPHFRQVRRWCLCEEAPEAHTNAFRYVIQIHEQPRSDVNQYVVELLKLLVHTEIIDDRTASLILITFKIPIPSDLPHPIDKEPLTKEFILNFQIGGNPIVAKKFVDYLIKLIQHPKPIDLIEVLLQVILNNQLVSVPQIIQISIRYRVIPDIHVVIVQPTTPVPITAPTTTPRAISLPATPAPIVTQSPPLFLTTQKGRPGVIGIVTIVGVVTPDQGRDLIHYLLTLLVSKKVIDQPTASRLLITFYIDSPRIWNINGTPLNSTHTIVINGEPKAKDKFLTILLRLLTNPRTPDISQLIKILAELLIDNGVVDGPSIQEIVEYYNIRIRIEIHEPTKATQPTTVPTTRATTPRPTPTFVVDKGYVSDTIIKIIKVLNNDHQNQLLQYLINLLVKNRVVDQPTGDRILITFIPNLPHHWNIVVKNPLTVPEFDKIKIGGHELPSEKFVLIFKSLLNKPKDKQTDLTKLLFEILIDNGYISPESADKIANYYGITINVEAIPIDGKRPEKITFDFGKIVRGQPGETKIVIVDIPEKSVVPAINALLEILVRSHLIDAPTANNLLLTFRLIGQGKFNPHDGTALTPLSIIHIKINTDEKPRRRFIDFLITLLKTPTQKTDLISALLTLILDTGAINMETLHEFLITFTIKARVKIHRIITEPVLKPGSQKPGHRIDSTVTVVKVAGDLPTYIARLLRALVVARVITQSGSDVILRSFQVSPDGELHFDGVVPVLNPDLINRIHVSANPHVRQKFYDQLKELVTHTTPNRRRELVTILLELILDTATYDLPSADQLSDSYGIDVDIKIVFIREGQPTPPPFVFPIVQVVPGEPSDSNVIIVNVFQPALSPLVTTVLNILVHRKVIDTPTANSFLNTFKVKPHGDQFDPSAAPKWTLNSILNINIQVSNDDDKPKHKFIETLRILLRQPSPQRLVSSLITLLLDSGAADLKTVYAILKVFRVSGQITIHIIPPIRETPLLPGQDPGPNKQLSSTVTITQVTRDLKPFIKRLLELLVRKTVFSISIANRILATLHIPASGQFARAEPFTPTEVAVLKIGGKDSPREKFVKNFSLVFKNPQAAQNLNLVAKILMEFIIDNAFYDYNSLSRFAVAYGIGNQIQIQVTTVHIIYDRKPVPASGERQQGWQIVWPWGHHGQQQQQQQQHWQVLQQQLHGGGRRKPGYGHQQHFGQGGHQFVFPLNAHVQGGQRVGGGRPDHGRGQARGYGRH